jgi:hypothetical protein
MRFLLYANDFADSLQGIVYTSSEFHYRGEPHANPPSRRTDGAAATFLPALTGFRPIRTLSGVRDTSGDMAAMPPPTPAWSNTILVIQRLSICLPLSKWVMSTTSGK